MWLSRSRRCLALLALLPAVAAIHVIAQQPTFRSAGVVVPVFVTVTDASQRLVTDLTQEDFEIFDNEKPQAITVFDNRYRPISVVIMLDTSYSMTGNLPLLRQAAEQFVLRLFPNDQAKIGAFHDRVEVAARFSSDRDTLIRDIRALDFGNRTRLYDGLDVGLDALEDAGERKVILVFTDGQDSDSKVGANAVLERSRTEEAMVYVIGLESNFFNGQQRVTSKPDKGLKKIAEETGGGFFELDKTSELGATFTRVAQELHSQYVMGFTPDSLDNKVHKLSVKVKRTGLIARARKSYLATNKRAGGGRTAPSRF